MNTLDITNQLYKWMIEFVEVGNLKLGGWPPCPYAKQARINNTIEIVFASIDKLSCVVDETTKLLEENEVVIICFDHKLISVEELQIQVKKINSKIMPHNFVILEDHPDSPEFINGVQMNFGECGLLLLQKLDKLSNASNILKSKGYYDVWTQTDLDSVVTWRQNEVL